MYDIHHRPWSAEMVASGEQPSVFKPVNHLGEIWVKPYAIFKITYLKELTMRRNGTQYVQYLHHVGIVSVEIYYGKINFSTYINRQMTVTCMQAAISIQLSDYRQNL
jgi:hypothetical protein